MKDGVSFCIPAYNCAAFLPHAVKSCQEQTLKNIEIIIVDDCSTDTTGAYLAWLEKQGDNRIKIIRNEKNMGRSASRNIANQNVSMDCICVLDSDDLALNQRAEWTLKKLRKCQVCYGSTMLINAIGMRARDLTAQPLDKAKILAPIDYMAWLASLEKTGRIDMHENMIAHSSVGYLKEIALKFPYTSGQISDLGIDDWFQQIEMLRAGITFDFIPDIICAYRVHDQGISKTRDIKEVVKLKATILSGEPVNV